ncbi:TPA: rhamnan synthesis F family protein [Photobacterium damselae]
MNKIFNYISKKVYKSTRPNIELNSEERIRIAQCCQRSQCNYQKKSDLVIVLHLYYFDVFDEYFEFLKEVGPFDILISIGDEITIDNMKYITSKLENVVFFKFDNVGRDIHPFIKCTNFIKDEDYKYLIKLHSKKSPHRIDGDYWRQALTYSLLGTKEIFYQNISLIDKGFSLICPEGHLFKIDSYWGGNEKIISKIDPIVNRNISFSFPAGSMYICDFFKIKQFTQYISSTELKFDEEKGQLDGTLAHAIERYIGFYFEKNNFLMVESKHKLKTTFRSLANVKYLCNLFSSILRN